MPLLPFFVQLEVDVSDSPGNLMSAFNFCNPFDAVLPFSDGNIGNLERQHLWGMSTSVTTVGAFTPSYYYYGVLMTGGI